MPHFKEGGAGSRELLASGVDRGVDRRSKCPWRKDVGGATVCVGMGGEEDIHRDTASWRSMQIGREKLGLLGVVPLPQNGRGWQS